MRDVSRLERKFYYIWLNNLVVLLLFYFTLYDSQGQMVCIESDGVTTLTTEAEERWKLEKEEERKKYVELLERERQDEKMARDRVLDQIENDKQARQMRQQQ